MWKASRWHLNLDAWGWNEDRVWVSTYTEEAPKICINKSPVLSGVETRHFQFKPVHKENAYCIRIPYRKDALLKMVWYWYSWFEREGVHLRSAEAANSSNDCTRGRARTIKEQGKCLPKTILHLLGKNNGMPTTLLQNRDFPLGQRNLAQSVWISLHDICILKSFQVLPDTDGVIGIHVFKFLPQVVSEVIRTPRRSAGTTVSKIHKPSCEPCFLMWVHSDSIFKIFKFLTLISPLFYFISCTSGVHIHLL